MTVDLARLHELRGWTPNAIVRLGVTFDGDRAVIPVHDETGKRVGRLRYQPDPKRLNGSPKMLADSGTPRALFPPPELVADDELPDRVLVLSEGEPDVLRLWSLGIAAVGVPGAQNWRDEWAARFSGRRWTVVICFDCDETGRTNGQRAASALVASGVDVRVLDLDPSRDDGYDLSDYAAAATTPELREQAARLLRETVATLPPFVPPQIETSETPDDIKSHTWVALDLIALGSTPPEPPSIGGLFYPGRRHVVSGEAEAGKSWLLLAIAVDEVRAEHGVVWVDDDDTGPGAVLERLRALELSDEQIASRFFYMRPEQPLDPRSRADVLALIEARDVRLLVFDAFNASLSLNGLDPSKTPDVEKFFRHIVSPFTDAGVAVVLPDHVTKNAEQRGKYAYGSERKHTGVDVHLGMRAIETFGRGHTAKAKLTVHKDRPGFLRRPTLGLFVLESDPDTGYCTWQIDVEQTVSDEGDFRPTHLMAKVSDYLYRFNAACSRTQIVSDVTGKTTAVRQAIDVLVAEGYASELDGPRGARLVQHERRFRDGD